MKILYVSDLDGTLLKSDDKMSEYTIKTINNLIDKGMCFSYATARSLSSSSVVTNGLMTNIPVIIYNGTFIVNAYTKERLFSLYFTEEEKAMVINFLNKYPIYPLVYGFINDEEKVSWIKSKENDGIKNYINLRKGDKRLRPVETKEELFSGKLFYFTCIGEKKELIDIYNYFKDINKFNCTLQQELYREEYWCEIMPKKATKGNAILTLKEKLKCDKIITFGDSINDIPMFKISDESYAVENAVIELKKYASGIIMSNEKDGVAHWLEENYKNKEKEKWINHWNNFIQ
jgi:Cof subfamily protein (haloacid dehalogenase superfamily)